MMLIVELPNGQWELRFPNGFFELFARLDLAIMRANCEFGDYEVIPLNLMAG